MEGERQRSKGKFFHLFDWNGKSRKKLFPNNSQLLEGPKPWKENVGSNLNSNSELHKVEMDDRRRNVTSTKGSSGEFSCASSVTSDDGYGTRPPSVVARLMGLDSMPISSVVESSSSLDLNTTSLGRNPPPQCNSSVPNSWSEYNPMDLLNVSTRIEGLRWSSGESRRPIERFKTETLPPRLAKSIPSTHHKLLSPIKTPGFTSSRNVAYIAEAAAKIMDSSPRAMATTKVPSIGLPSVPMRIRDLKQKMEAAHSVSRLPHSSNESCTYKNLNGQRRAKSNSGSEGLYLSRRPVVSGNVSPESVREKGKSVSQTVQSRTSVQRPDGSQTRSNSMIKQKDRIEASQPNRSVHKKPTEIRNNVLKQNHQKQNNLSKKDSSSSTVKHSVPNQQRGRAETSSGSSGSSRIVSTTTLKSQVPSRKIVTGSKNSKKEKRKTSSQKKQPVTIDTQSGSSTSSAKGSYNKDLRSIECSISSGECMNSSTSNGKNGMDVVSFTFTSPMASNVSKSPTSDQAMRMTSGFSVDAASTKNGNSCRHAISLPGIGGDDLGVLLEQKLRELTDKVESSRCNVIREDNCASPTASSQKPAEENVSDLILEKDLLHQANGGCLSTKHLLQNSNHDHQYQQSEELEDHSGSSSYSDRGNEHPSFTWKGQSCSDTQGSSDQRSPTQVSNSISEVSANGEVETELSDSATSSTMEVGNWSKTMEPFTTTKNRDSVNWELDYVRDMLEAAETRLEDLALGCTTSKIISPTLFKDKLDRNDENCNLDRKVLFDCIVEFVDSKCRRNSVETCKAWSELRGLFGRKGLLAKELQKKMTEWKSMGELMVDELVDIDMSSSKHGRWLEFDLEAFEEGVEIEEEILASLVDDLVCDLVVV
ncbi:hypothetical protein LINPERHAP1_LOCUS43300 [Linum perenne]